MALAPSRALVLRPVQLDHRGVEVGLILRIHPDDRLGNLAIHRVHGLQHALAEVQPLVAVAQLHRLMRTRRRARRDGGAAEAAVLQQDVDLHRRIAAAVEDLPAMHVDDCGHVMILLAFGLARLLIAGRASGNHDGTVGLLTG